MKKYGILCLVGLLSAGAASAQSKINTRGQMLLDLHKQGKLELVENLGGVEASSRGGEYMAGVLVETNSQALLDSLSAEGYEVTYISDNFSIVDMPLDGIETLAESKAVKSLSFGEYCEPTMDVARVLSGVKSVHEGRRLGEDGSTRPYKGEGVIVGMFDTGFDPSHVNFYNDDQSVSRLRYFARFTGAGAYTAYTGNSCVSAPTDNSNEDHGTHVAGIMGGAYNGPGVYKSEKGNLGKDKGSVPLYGVAPKADMAIAAGTLYNASILKGLRLLIDYAKAQGKPIALNLSLGSNFGPHDGTEADVRALSDLGKEAIICIAAGNDGDALLHAGKTFSNSDKRLSVFVDGNKGKGKACIWASNSTEFTAGFAVVNSTNGEIMALVKATPGKSITIGSTDDTSAENRTFRDYFSGTITMKSSLDNYNKRYNYDIEVNGVSLKSGKNALLALVVEGSAGQRIDVYGNENFVFTEIGHPGYDKPDYNGTISSMACGSNVIVVGAYNAHPSWFSIAENKQYNYISGYGEGAIAPYSSWGELLDGRKLPHICAPGSGIFSSDNGSFVAANPSKAAATQIATAEFNGKTHYWCMMQGTSMACPYTTGTMALWLEADPNLTVDKAREIMENTAIQKGFTLDTKWGAGKLDAINGIKEVIAKKNSGIEDIVVGDAFFDVTVEGGSIRVDVASANSLMAELYSLSGVKVTSATASGESLSLSTDGAAKGIYLLRMTADGRTETRKVVL